MKNKVTQACPAALTERLFGMPRGDFVRDYFERLPLHAERQAAVLQLLPTLPEFAETLQLITSDALTLRRSGKTPPTPCFASGIPDLSAVWAQFYDGASIVADRLHCFDERTRRMSTQLSYELAHRVGVNAYLSPLGGGAFDTHYDTHDVLVVQIAGEKAWLLYERPSQVPAFTAKQHVDLPKDALEGRLLREVLMRPGDVLYLPRGMPHRAETVRGCSLHFSFGLVPIDWAEVLEIAIGILRKDDPAYRKHVSPDVFVEPATQLNATAVFEFANNACTKAVLDKVLQTIRKQLLQESAPAPRPVLDLYDAESFVGWSAGVFCEITESVDGSLIVSNGVKATKLAGSEAMIFRLIHNKARIALRELDLEDRGEHIPVIERLSALGLVCPAS